MNRHRKYDKNLGAYSSPSAIVGSGWNRPRILGRLRPHRWRRLREDLAHAFGGNPGRRPHDLFRWRPRTSLESFREVPVSHLSRARDPDGDGIEGRIQLWPGIRGARDRDRVAQDSRHLRGAGQMGEVHARGSIDGPPPESEVDDGGLRTPRGRSSTAPSTPC